MAVITITLAPLALAPRPSSAEWPAGTFSIVARDSVTGELGVAVQSRAFSVGMAVPWAEAGVGAIATQASTNESFGPQGLALLKAGLTADEALAHLIAHDPERDHRQLGIVDDQGHSAAHTGKDCLNWAGQHTGRGYSCQGNILAGPKVVDDMARAYQTTRGTLARRLLAALEAAQKAGGDRRGQQSAALLVARPSARFPEYRTRYIDLRVEDHRTPIAELIRVYDILEASDLVEAHLRYAEDYEATGDRAGAAREREEVGRTLDRVLARHTKDAGLLNGLAWNTALANTHLDQALVAAKRAAKLEPKSFEILDTLAEVHFRRGEINEAIAVERRALALEPGSTYLKEQIARFEAAAGGQARGR